jgi:hypothetical protein
MLFEPGYFPGGGFGRRSTGAASGFDWSHGGFENRVRAFGRLKISFSQTSFSMRIGNGIAFTGIL